jgi:hypothetical protein
MPRVLTAPKSDPSLKKRFAALSKIIATAGSEGASAYDEYWEAVGAILAEPALFLAGGYRNARDYCKRALRVDLRVAQRNVRVAKFATPQEEQTYGPSILDAALGLLEARAGHSLRGKLPISFERLRVPVVRGKQRKSVPLLQATKAEIQAATRALVKQPSRGTAAQQSLAKSLAKKKVLAGVHVSEANGFATFTHVPISAMAAFREALLGFALPKIPK